MTNTQTTSGKSARKWLGLALALISLGALGGVLTQPIYRSEVSVDKKILRSILDKSVADLQRKAAEQRGFAGSMIASAIGQAFDNRQRDAAVGTFQKKIEESFGNGEKRLLQLVDDLFNHGDTLLALAVLISGLVFPLVKVVACGFLFALPAPQRRYRFALNIFEYISRFSFMDVFVAALIIVIMKSDGLLKVTVEPQAGLWLMATAALTSLVAFSVLHDAEEENETTLETPTQPTTVTTTYDSDVTENPDEV